MHSLKYLQQTTYKLKYILKMSHYSMNLNLLTNVNTSTTYYEQKSCPMGSENMRKMCNFYFNS